MNLRKAAQALIDHWDAGEYKNCTGYMAGHIADLKDALQPKVISKPKLSETDQKIVEYCCRPRTSTEIAIYARVSMSAAYKSLRLLQRLGLLEKMQVDKPTGHNHGVTFKATGKPIEEDWIPQYMSFKPMVMGVRL
jgi:hypothetical protein